MSVVTNMSVVTKLVTAISALTLSGAVPLHAQDDDGGGWRTAPQVAAISAQDYVYGTGTARFSVIVWLDPECPFCKQLGTIPEHVVDEGQGQVNLAVRFYPLPFHGPNAVLGSVAALCVGQQAGSKGFYRFLDGWLAMTGSNGKGLGTGDGKHGGDPVAGLASASGAADAARLAACTTAKATTDRLTRDVDAADKAGVTGTPAIAIRDNRMNRTLLVEGAISGDDMKAAINFLAGQPADGAPDGGKPDA